MPRVLVVDDARLLADLSGTALGRGDVEILRAAASDDLVERAAELTPELVIVTDGDACFEPLGVCRRLRAQEKTRHATIVYVGSYLSPETTRRAGIDLFVPRFVRPERLRETLGRALDVPRRSARRRPVALPCTIVVDGAARSGTCEDLSLGGCFVALDAAPGAGARVTLRFDGADGAPEVAARVVRAGDGPSGTRGAGLAFELTDPMASAALSRFVREAAERRETVASETEAR